MDFSFDDEQLAVAELARQILTDGATMARMRELEKSDGPRFDEKLWSELAEAGLIGVAIDEAYGGAGLGFMELALVIEQVGRTAAPVPLLETAALAAFAISKFGTVAQREALLPRVARGDAILTAALSEFGTEGESPLTRAVADGDGWKLTGTKICIPAGQLAERILVPAVVEGGQVAIFLVDPKAPGAKLEELTTTSRQPEASLVLANLRVGPEDLLGDLGGGSEILRFILEHGTAAYCALALGVCEVALDLTAEYTKSRKQFGQSIATFQAVGQRAADAYVDTEGIRLTAWQAAWRLSEGLPASSQVAVAKIWAAEAGQRVVHAAAHLHGGAGVDRDYPLHRYFLYAKQLELSLGGSTDHLRKLGKLIAA